MASTRAELPAGSSSSSLFASAVAQFDELPKAARPIVGNTTAAHITQI
jgi:hypothetical protein